MYEDLEPYWRAFAQLHRRRPAGFGACPIPVADIAAWLDLNEIGGLEERLEYFELIGVLDAEWMDWASSRKKEEKRDAGTQPRH